MRLLAAKTTDTKTESYVHVATVEKYYVSDPDEYVYSSTRQVWRERWAAARFGGRMACTLFKWVLYAAAIVAINVVGGAIEVAYQGLKRARCELAKGARSDARYDVLVPWLKAPSELSLKELSSGIPDKGREKVGIETRR